MRKLPLVSVLVLRTTCVGSASFSREPAVSTSTVALGTATPVALFACTEPLTLPVMSCANHRPEIEPVSGVVPTRDEAAANVEVERHHGTVRRQVNRLIQDDLDSGMARTGEIDCRMAPVF